MSTDTNGSAWSARWLDLAEKAPTFPEPSLRRGADYAAFDWQLDADIEPGSASTTASSGRMHYDASITVPTLSTEQVADIVASIASRTERIAAVLDGELPVDLPHLMSFDPAQIVPSCSCRSVDQPCKHAGAVVQLVADAISDDPFDLLHLRGLPRSVLVTKLTESRRDPHDQVAAPAPAATDAARPNPSEPELRFAPASGPLPADLPHPESPGQLAPFPTPPPAGASFTEQGLRLLADDGARRATELLHRGTHPWTDLDASTDLARRAADLEHTAFWKDVVDRAQVTSQELRARAVAWRAGGPSAVSAHIAPVEVEADPDEPAVQRRRAADGTWVRFEKMKGRWLVTGLVDGPARADAPEDRAVADDPVTSVDRPNNEWQ